MKGLAQLIVLVLLSGPAVLPAPAAFSSIYIFGDGVSTTTDNPFAGPYYYGLRRCNGRVWVEVLAQRQGLGSDSITNVNWSYSSNNLSYFGHNSSQLVSNVNGFVPPANANSALFVVWVNDADFVNTMDNFGPNNPAAWVNASNLSITNHWRALTNLYYAKGARTFVMPNAVDITEIPAYAFVADPGKTAVRQAIMAFNTSFAVMLNQARASLPGVKIYSPDMFALLDDFIAHAANYGLTNALDADGYSIDAVSDPSLSDLSRDGPGASYIFWDAYDPSSKAHEVMADIAQQLVSPAGVNNLTLLEGSNRLDLVNRPIDLSGYVDGRANLVLGSWTSVTNFNSTNAPQAIFVPASGPWRFYRLRFPFAWSWP